MSDNITSFVAEVEFDPRGKPTNEVALVNCVNITFYSSQQVCGSGSHL